MRALFLRKDSPTNPEESTKAPDPIREAFIPLHPQELIAQLETLPGVEPAILDRLRTQYESLSETIHSDFRRKHLGLSYRYSRFDPDRDATPVSSVPQASIGEVLESIENLLVAANYYRLTPSQIEETMQTASAWGIRLRIRFRDFRKLRVYARGDACIQRTRNDWWRLYFPREVDVPIYRKLVIMYEPSPKRLARPKPKQAKTKTQEADTVIAKEASELDTSLFLKMFKNVPHLDVDMLLPGVVRMSLLEQGKIGIPTIWGFALLVSKLVRNIWLLALVGAMQLLTSMTFIAACVLAGVWYSVKVFFSYRHERNRKMLNVAQSLYYQTLSNNAGVLLRLVDEAEQQKLCEALVLLYVMWKDPSAGPHSLQSLDANCESLLNTLSVGPVDFDINATARFLVGRGIITATDQGWRSAQ
jgi:hypothetical protein